MAPPSQRFEEEDLHLGAFPADFGLGTTPPFTHRKGLRSKSSSGKSDGGRRKHKSGIDAGLEKGAKRQSLAPSQKVLRGSRHLKAERIEMDKERRQERAQARAFKELDVTLEVLGISERDGRGGAGTSTITPLASLGVDRSLSSFSLAGASSSVRREISQTSLFTPEEGTSGASTPTPQLREMVAHHPIASRSMPSLLRGSLEDELPPQVTLAPGFGPSPPPSAVPAAPALAAQSSTVTSSSAALAAAPAPPAAAAPASAVAPKAPPQQQQQQQQQVQQQSPAQAMAPAVRASASPAPAPVAMPQPQPSPFAKPAAASKASKKALTLAAPTSSPPSPRMLPAASGPAPPGTAAPTAPATATSAATPATAASSSAAAAAAAPIAPAVGGIAHALAHHRRALSTPQIDVAITQEELTGLARGGAGGGGSLVTVHQPVGTLRRRLAGGDVHADLVTDREAVAQKLAAERMQLQMQLHDVLDAASTEEDVHATVEAMVEQAEALGQELVELSTPPETIHEIEHSVAWLEECHKRASNILKQLRPHKQLMARSLGSSDRYNHALLVMLPELATLAAICAESLVQVLDDLAVAAPSEEDVRAVFKCAKRITESAAQISHKLREELSADTSAETLEEISTVDGQQATAVAAMGFAAIEAARKAGSDLLQPESLTRGRFVHQTATKARLLQLLWQECSKLAWRVGKSWAPWRFELWRELCGLYLTAAHLAAEMQGANMPGREGEDALLDEEEEEEEEDDTYQGVWGASTRSRPKIVLGDEDVQAQGWVPSLLLALLGLAQEAHKGLRKEVANIEDQQDVDSDDLESAYLVLDSIQSAFSELALANTRRTAALCAGPEPLACWALEILQEQATQALSLVQQYDRGSLGLGDLLVPRTDGGVVDEEEARQVQRGQQLFSSIKSATYRVVKRLLRIRQLLNIRKADDSSDVQPPALRNTASVRRPQTTSARPALKIQNLRVPSGSGGKGNNQAQRGQSQGQQRVSASGVQLPPQQQQLRLQGAPAAAAVSQVQHPRRRPLSPRPSAVAQAGAVQAARPAQGAPAWTQDAQVVRATAAGSAATAATAAVSSAAPPQLQRQPVAAMGQPLRLPATSSAQQSAPLQASGSNAAAGNVSATPAVAWSSLWHAAFAPHHPPYKQPVSTAGATPPPSTAPPPTSSTSPSVQQVSSSSQQAPRAAPSSPPANSSPPALTSASATASPPSLSPAAVAAAATIAERPQLAVTSPSSQPIQSLTSGTASMHPWASDVVEKLAAQEAELQEQGEGELLCRVTPEGVVCVSVGGLSAEQVQEQLRMLERDHPHHHASPTAAASRTIASSALVHPVTGVSPPRTFVEAAQLQPSPTRTSLGSRPISLTANIGAGGGGGGGSSTPMTFSLLSPVSASSDAGVPSAPTSGPSSQSSSVASSTATTAIPPLSHLRRISLEAAAAAAATAPAPTAGGSSWKNVLMSAKAPAVAPAPSSAPAPAPTPATDADGAAARAAAALLMLAAGGGDQGTSGGTTGGGCGLEQPHDSFVSCTSLGPPASFKAADAGDDRSRDAAMGGPPLVLHPSLHSDSSFTSPVHPDFPPSTASSAAATIRTSMGTAPSSSQPQSSTSVAASHHLQSSTHSLQSPSHSGAWQMQGHSAPFTLQPHPHAPVPGNSISSPHTGVSSHRFDSPRPVSRSDGGIATATAASATAPAGSSSNTANVAAVAPPAISFAEAVTRSSAGGGGAGARERGAAAARGARAGAGRGHGRLFGRGSRTSGDLGATLGHPPEPNFGAIAAGAAAAAAARAGSSAAVSEDDSDFPQPQRASDSFSSFAPPALLAAVGAPTSAAAQTAAGLHGVQPTAPAAAAHAPTVAATTGPAGTSAVSYCAVLARKSAEIARPTGSNAAGGVGQLRPLSTAANGLPPKGAVTAFAAAAGVGGGQSSPDRSPIASPGKRSHLVQSPTHAARQQQQQQQQQQAQAQGQGQHTTSRHPQHQHQHSHALSPVPTPMPAGTSPFAGPRPASRLTAASPFLVSWPSDSPPATAPSPIAQRLAVATAAAGVTPTASGPAASPVASYAATSAAEASASVAATATSAASAPPALPLPTVVTPASSNPIAIPTAGKSGVSGTPDELLLPPNNAAVNTSRPDGHHSNGVSPAAGIGSSSVSPFGGSSNGASPSLRVPNISIDATNGVRAGAGASNGGLPVVSSNGNGGTVTVAGFSPRSPLVSPFQFNPSDAPLVGTPPRLQHSSLSPFSHSTPSLTQHSIAQQSTAHQHQNGHAHTQNQQQQPAALPPATDAGAVAAVAPDLCAVCASRPTTPDSPTTISAVQASHSTQQQHQVQSTNHAVPPPQLVVPVTPMQAPAASSRFSMPDDAFWAVKWDELKGCMQKQIGSGSFGQVWAGQFRHNTVAVKVIMIDRVEDFDEAAVASFRKEVELQRQLSHHPNIVRFTGACCEYAQGDKSGCSGPPMLAIVMEYCKLGNVMKMVKQAAKVQAAAKANGGVAVKPPPGTPSGPALWGYEFYTNWERRLQVALGAAAGLAYMHTCGVVHRDLTSYNLLIDTNWTCKVCDFNLSRRLPNASFLANSGNVNSPGWQSPEVLTGADYDLQTDVFSYGVVLWEIITLKEPWVGEDDVRRNMFYIVKQVSAGVRLTFPPVDSISPPLPELQQLIDLAQSCWEQDPLRRPRMQTIADTLFALVQRVKERKNEERKATAAVAAKAKPQSQRT